MTDDVVVRFGEVAAEVARIHVRLHGLVEAEILARTTFGEDSESRAEVIPFMRAELLALPDALAHVRKLIPPPQGKELPLSQLGLGTRGVNALARKHIITIDDLYERSGQPILRSRGIGFVTAYQVLKGLRQYGFEIPERWSMDYISMREKILRTRRGKNTFKAEIDWDFNP